MEGIMAGRTLGLRAFPVAVAFALIFTLIISDARVGAAQTPGTVQVVAVTGEAAVTRGNGPGRALAANATVSAGDTVKTGTGSKCQLRFGDGSVVTLGEGSELKIAEYRIRGDDRRGVLELARGVARAVVTKMSPKSSFEIQTSTAVAAVRSTVWMIGYDAAGATEVFVGEGSVAVTSRGAQLARVVLEPGLGTTVAKDKAPLPPETWAQTRAVDMRQRASMP
jgi:hypothetical protein